MLTPCALADVWSFLFFGAVTRCGAGRTGGTDAACGLRLTSEMLP